MLRLSTIALIGASLIPQILAQTVLKTLDAAHATVYYDLTNQLCTETFSANWAVGINGGIPYCQGQTARSLKDLGTNSIVAMDMNMVKGNPAEWCGKV
jgi:hypothetical protein